MTYISILGYNISLVIESTLLLTCADKFLGLFAIFCLLLFIGAIVHSRCILIMFSVFGLFSIIFLWLTASVYLTAAVALGDFCIKPTPFIIHKLEGNKVALEKRYSSASRSMRDGPPPYPWIAKEISTFYLECSPITNPGRQSPFQQHLSVGKN